MLFHCGFDFHFLNDLCVEYIFMYVLAICILLWRNVYSRSLPVFDLCDIDDANFTVV